MYNNYPNSNSNTGISTNNTDFYAKDELIPIFPMKSYTDNISNKSMNITIISASGLEINLPLPGNTTVNDMFKKYLDRLQLPYSHLGKNIKFIYNTKNVDPFSQMSIFYIFPNYAVITAIEPEGVIGGIY